MNKFIDGLSQTYNNIKYMAGIVIALAYMVFHRVFLEVTIAGTAAMQLEDSTAGYAVGKQLATGATMYTWFLAASVLLLVYSVVKLILNNIKKVK